MPNYRFKIAMHDITDEDEIGDLYNFVDWESKSGGWDTNPPGVGSELWYGVRFERKAEAIYFKTRFNAIVLEWDESGIEPRTKEELLAEGYLYMQARVHTKNRMLFNDWCEKHNVGVVDEIKFIRNEIEPYNLYVPPDLVEEMKMLWGAKHAEVCVEDWKRLTQE